MKVSKNYKKQYKENVEKVSKHSKNKLDDSWQEEKRNLLLEHAGPDSDTKKPE